MNIDKATEPAWGGAFNGKNCSLGLWAKTCIDKNLLTSDYFKEIKDAYEGTGLEDIVKDG